MYANILICRLIALLILTFYRYVDTYSIMLLALIHISQCNAPGDISWILCYIWYAFTYFICIALSFSKYTFPLNSLSRWAWGETLPLFVEFHKLPLFGIHERKCLQNYFMDAKWKSLNIPTHTLNIEVSVINMWQTILQMQ